MLDPMLREKLWNESAGSTVTSDDTKHLDNDGKIGEYAAKALDPMRGAIKDPGTVRKFQATVEQIMRHRAFNGEKITDDLANDIAEEYFMDYGGGSGAFMLNGENAKIVVPKQEWMLEPPQSLERPEGPMEGTVRKEYNVEKKEWESIDQKTGEDITELESMGTIPGQKGKFDFEKNTAEFFETSAERYMGDIESGIDPDDVVLLDSADPEFELTADDESVFLEENLTENISYRNSADGTGIEYYWDVEGYTAPLKYKDGRTVKLNWKQLFAYGRMKNRRRGGPRQPGESWTIGTEKLGYPGKYLGQLKKSKTPLPGMGMHRPKQLREIRRKKAEARKIDKDYRKRIKNNK